MGRGAFLKTSFNAGELSPLLDGRSDLEKYPQGCSLLENFIPTVQGPIYHRPGTQFVENLGGSNPVLVPFVYNRDQAYVLAIGPVIRVYADRGIVEASPGVPYTFGAGVWSAPPRRADGSSRLSYTQSGDILFVCDADGGLPLMAIKRLGHASWTIEAQELASPPPEEWREGTCLLYKRLHASASDAPTGEYYLAIDVGEVSAEYLFSTTFIETVADLQPTDPDGHYMKTLRKGKVFLDFASRLNSDARAYPTAPPFNSAAIAENVGRVVQWTPDMYVQAGQVVMNGGRFYEPVTQGVMGGAPTHTSQRQASDAGMFYLGNGISCFEIIESGISDLFESSDGSTFPIWCARVRIAPHPSNEEDLSGRIFDRYFNGMTATIGSIPARSASVHFKCKRWAPAAFRDFTVADGDTSTLIGDLPDNVAIFRERLVLSKVRDIHASVAGDFYNFARLDASGQVAADAALDLTLQAGDLSSVSWMAPSDRLVLGSPGGERAIGEQNISNAFGPTNVKVDVTAATGSVDVGPALVGRDILMLDRTGRRLIRTGLTQDGQGFANLSALADHIGLASPFIAMAWREVPTPVLFLASAAGQLVGCTFEPSQDVASWHRHNVGGLVRDVVAIPSLDGTRDDLWLLVERTVLESQMFYLEVMPDDYRMGLQVEDARYLDSSVSYTGAPADEFSGLGHLEGEQVQAVGDGFVYTGLTVNLGTVTLPQEHAKVTIGKYQPARVRTMRLHLGADDGVNMGKIARNLKASARLVDTVNIRAGGDFVNMNRLDFRDGAQSMDVAVPSQSEERSWSPRGGYSPEAYLCLEQDQPLPATIVSLGLEFEVN